MPPRRAPRMSCTAVVLLLLSSMIAVPVRGEVSGADGTWSAVPPPTGRFLGTAAYDGNGHRILLFGGLDGAPRSDLWALDLAGLGWSVLDPPSAPPPRSGHSLVRDAAQERWLLFGGTDDSPFNPDEERFHDVWSLSLEGGSSWTEILPSGDPPTARKGHTAVYDAAGQRMILFGGDDGALRNDVWALDLSGAPAWTQLFPSADPPAPRANHAAVFDAARGRMLIFGGDSGVRENDVWELDLAGAPQWTELSPAGDPPAGRQYASALHDAPRDRWIIFGGFGVGLHNDVWSLALAGAAAWTEITPGGDGPNPRSGHQAVLDPVSESMVILAGSDASFQLPTDVWALPLPDPVAWSELPAQAGPPGKMSHTAIFDVEDERVVVFGGRDVVMESDVWVLPATGVQEWTELAATGDPPAQPFDHAAVYDPLRDRMVVFGGEASNETWDLTLGAETAWTELLPSGGPPEPRVSHTAVYDPTGDRMIVFGGYGGFVLRNDLWELSFAAMEWTELLPPGPLPEPRRDHVAVYDAARDRMLIFSGNSGFAPLLNDVWELDLTGDPVWTELDPSGPLPEGPLTHAALYDPVRDRLVTFGGSYHNEVWALDLVPSPAWRRLDPAGALPTGRVDHAVAYDPVGDRMISFGGHSGLTTMGDTWVLDWNDPAGASDPRSGITWSVMSFPNPARDATTIRFDLPREGTASLRVYDGRGRLVRRLVEGSLGAGAHAARWDLTTGEGDEPAAGVYFYELRAGGMRRSGRVLVVR